MQYVFMALMTLFAVFMILLVLVQRGKGGGLAGALGGMGGQSAFGSKAGDLFTKITVVAAFLWIVLCVGAVWYLGGTENKLGDVGKGKKSSEAVDAPADTDGGTPGKEGEGSSD